MFIHDPHAGVERTISKFADEEALLTLLSNREPAEGSRYIGALGYD